MRRHRWGKPSARFLEAQTQVRVRFQEVDALRVVWHGHYLSYFEEGRTALGRKYEFGYQEMLAAGYVAPLVHIEIDYLAPARMEELLTIRSRLHETSAATIHFSYLVSGESGRQLASGISVQAFTDLAGELVLTRPTFYVEFLERFDSELNGARAR